MIQLPKEFVQTIKSVHKEKGEQWLNHFNMLIEECEARWDIQIMLPFPLSYNFVAPAVQRDGTEVVVKLVVPGEEFHAEVHTIQQFNGRAMVEIIDVDLKKGILILERLTPGNMLETVEDDEAATRIASRVMKKLWVPASDTLQIPTSEDREKALLKILIENPDGIGPITKKMLQGAAETFTALNKSIEKPYLLHGDLHHYNILNNGSDSWTAIDPKGLISDREYEVIQFLLNRLPAENFSAVIDKRIALLSEELDLDTHRIYSWGFAHSVLATCWSIEDHENYDEAFYQSIQYFWDHCRPI
ncbi:aminoglycoside phosphotransferase family protein [Cytobacillus massiliigabonensis]|uniref:aminoglycoside phosphotransferase family protein n=1 Tax=Cytobacillus massiliigabonensis TaxID=1871011 RepID=UPI0015E0E850|nr:aminoglycoside phosphotransferase family protein [Cytobacillus massiliigabonensis]